MSERPELLCTVVYFFTIVVSSGWANTSGEGHWHCFAHNPHDHALDLEGALEGELVLTSGWTYIYPEGHCFSS